MNANCQVERYASGKRVLFCGEKVCVVGSESGPKEEGRRRRKKSSRALSFWSRLEGEEGRECMVDGLANEKACSLVKKILPWERASAEEDSKLSMQVW